MTAMDYYSHCFISMYPCLLNLKQLQLARFVLEGCPEFCPELCGWWIGDLFCIRLHLFVLIKKYRKRNHIYLRLIQNHPFYHFLLCWWGQRETLLVNMNNLNMALHQLMQSKREIKLSEAFSEHEGESIIHRSVPLSHNVLSRMLRLSVKSYVKKKALTSCTEEKVAFIRRLREKNSTDTEWLTVALCSSHRKATMRHFE